MVSEKLCIDKLDVITIKEILLVMNKMLGEIGKRQFSIMRNQHTIIDRMETIEDLFYEGEEEGLDPEESQKCACKHERDEADVCDDILDCIQQLRALCIKERKEAECKDCK